MYHFKFNPINLSVKKKMLINFEGRVAMDNFSQELLDKRDQFIKVVTFFLTSSFLFRYLDWNLCNKFEEHLLQ